MEIKQFTDSHQRVVEVHVNMGRELTIYQKYPWSDVLDSYIAFLPLSALRYILEFCEECQQKPTITPYGNGIVKRSVEFFCGDIKVTAWFDIADFVTIKNSFRDADGTTFHSELSYLLLASLQEAVAFGNECEQEFIAMIEGAKKG